MSALPILARLETIFLVAGFAAVILWKLLTGGIRLEGLLQAGNGDSGFSPGRAQLLAITIFTSMYYLIQTVHEPSRIPQIPSGLVTALGGSQAIYLSGKAWSMLGGLIKEKK